MARRSRRKSGNSSVDIILPEPHSGQVRVQDARDRFNVLVAGRRWGKTSYALNLAIDGYSADDHASILNGGIVGWWVGKESQFSEVWSTVYMMLRSAASHTDANLHEIRLPNGGGVDFWTLYSDPNAGRGRKYHRAIIDEAAFAARLEDSWATTILPTLVDYSADAWIMSSAKSRTYFQHLARRGDIKSPFHRTGWKTHVAPTWDNPHIDPDQIEVMRAEMTDSEFRQEFGAEFVEGKGGRFKREWLRWYQVELPVQSMVRVILCDPASGEKKVDGEDYTVFWVLGLNDDGNYYVLDFVRERMDLVERAAMLFALHRHYKPQHVGYEKVGMQSDVAHIRHEMEQRHYRFDIHTITPSMKKDQRINRLVGPFKQGRVWFPGTGIRNRLGALAHRVLKEWVEIEFLTYPSAEHDDGLDALAQIFDVGADFGTLNPEPEEPEFYPRQSLGSVLHDRF